MPDSNASASTIRCDQLSVRFADGTIGLADIAMEVAAGQIVALVGPSGCGKTTLLRTVAGLQQASSGSVDCSPTPTSGRLAFVFQQPALLPWRTAIENVALPLELTGTLMSKRSKRELAAERLGEVGLAEDAHHKYPHELSGGMQMRVSIARALATDPSLLLLDEPFAALDDILRNRLGELVLSLWRQRRRTMILVTHNVAEAILMSHRVIVMRSGRSVGEIAVDLPDERNATLRRSPEFGEYYGRVADLLRAGDDE